MTRQAAIEPSISNARSRIATQARSLAAAQRAARAAAEVSATEAPSVAGGGRSRNIYTLVQADPELMELYLKSFRANLSDRFGPLFERLGLTPYQIGKWEDMATAQEQSNIDLRLAATAQGLVYSQDPGIQAMKKQSGEKLDQEFVAAVGADAAQQIKNGISGYDAVPNGMVRMVTNVANWAAQNGTPMNYQQMGQLGSILASNFTPDPALGGSMDWGKITSQASTSLSAPQVDAIQTMASLYQLSARVKQFYSQQGAAP
jgi:hypothetical protein